jgi:integrase
METNLTTTPHIPRPKVFQAGDGPRVTVYCVRSRGTKTWEVRDKIAGRGHRQRRKFADRDEAMRYAQTRAIFGVNQTSARWRLTYDQCWDAEQALLKLRPAGKSLLQLACEEMERWELAQRLTTKQSPLVADVVAQFLADKARQAVSDFHLRGLKIRLNRFSQAFHLPINQVAHPELAAWLDSLNVSGRTWNNYREALAGLATFAKHRKYLPADWTEVEAIAPIKLKRRRIQIWTPDNMSALLSASSKRLLPALVISAFAGLRSEEVQRLRWEDVKWDKDYIFLREEITKTARTRTVPLLEGLAEWLRPWSEASGPVSTFKDLAQPKCRLARRLGLTWSRNILRDSFISYRLAATQNLAQVALEAGNSPAIIHRAYLELTTAAEAAKWFSILPRSLEQNVLPLKFR